MAARLPFAILMSLACAVGCGSGGGGSNKAAPVVVPPDNSTWTSQRLWLCNLAHTPIIGIDWRPASSDPIWPDPMPENQSEYWSDASACKWKDFWHVGQLAEGAYDIRVTWLDCQDMGGHNGIQSCRVSLYSSLLADNSSDHGIILTVPAGTLAPYYPPAPPTWTVVVNNYTDYAWDAILWRPYDLADTTCWHEYGGAGINNSALIESQPLGWYDVIIVIDGGYFPVGAQYIPGPAELHEEVTFLGFGEAEIREARKLSTGICQ